VHRELAPLVGRTKDPTLAAEAEACLKQSLKTMETVWLKDSPFLAGGSQPSIADISSACELQQLKVSNFFLDQSHGCSLSRDHFGSGSCCFIILQCLNFCGCLCTVFG
jgi:glutathione S-transferase